MEPAKDKKEISSPRSTDTDYKPFPLKQERVMSDFKIMFETERFNAE